MKEGKNFWNKIGTSSRFVLARVGLEERALKRPRATRPHVKKIFAALDKTSKEVCGLLESFEFGAALHTLYDFYWHDFCDIFIEEAKRDESAEVKNALFFVLASSLKLMHPFVPFVTEHIWTLMPIAHKRLLIVEEI